MRIIENIYKCAVCNKEAKYNDVLSWHNFGYGDMDGKPKNDSIIGFNIKECPHCHYVSFDITEPIVHKYCNNLKDWQKSKILEEMQKIKNDRLRKIVGVARQYEENQQYFLAYKTFINASWVCDNEEDESYYRQVGLKILFDNVLKRVPDEILIICDLLRMDGHFEDALEFLDLCDGIFDDETENEFKIHKALIQMAKNKDNKRHSLEEIIK